MIGSSNFTVDLWIWRCLGFALDWPALSSSSALPLLWICSWSLASLRYNQATPPCWGSSKLSRSPFLFQVLNWKPIDTPPDEDIVVPGNWRKLSGPVNVTATETGSAHEKVTLPWEGNTQSGEKEEVWQKKRYYRDKTTLNMNINQLQRACWSDLMSPWSHQQVSLKRTLVLP